MWLIGVSALIGILLGGLSAYLLVTFEQKWYKFITAIIGIAAPSSFMTWLHNYYGADDTNSKLISAFFLFLFFIISFIVVLKILIGLIIKVGSPNDVGVIRTRDIILGRKDYIEAYYNARKKQIDERLNLPALEKREKEISIREAAAEEYDVYLKGQLETIRKGARKKLTITLPDKKIIILDDEFIGQLPSFLDGFSQCVSSIKSYIQTIKEEYGELDYLTVQTALTNICVSVMTCLFGDSTQVRTHFRIYNPETKQYELLVGVEGKQFIDTLTPIPYENSMIEQSDICHQALIKSLNPNSTKYNGNNSTIWKDYMTYSFYSFRHDNKPIISFGISVKNEKRYKYLFYFLNYARFENYLRSSVMELNTISPIEQVLYLTEVQ